MQSTCSLESVEITSSNRVSLLDVYKKVFSGHPWHEELICTNSLKKDEDPQKCLAQYSTLGCEKYDTDKSSHIISNDCRISFVKRENIFPLSIAQLENKCLGCKSRMELIEFYPDFVDHSALISEAISEDGFIGYLAFGGDGPVGFSWGYRLPSRDTLSVLFSKVTSLLASKGIYPEDTFYGSEVGVIDTFQGRGIGSSVSALRIIKAFESGYSVFLTRTINPYIHVMLRKMFAGKEGQLLFKDPERTSSWYKWDFKNLNLQVAEDFTLKARLK